MRSLWERGSVRIMALALAFPVIVAISSGVDALVGSDELDAGSAAVYLIPIALFGLVVAKGWVLALPMLWAALLLVVLRIADLITGECSVCSSDEDWGNYPFFFLVIVVVPMTVALFIGVAIGALARPRWRSEPRPVGTDRGPGT
jgi:hypothetical protein